MRTVAGGASLFAAPRQIHAPNAPDGAGKDDTAIAHAGGMGPFNRIGPPGDVTFPASDRASWAQGRIVQANGGMV